MEFARRAQDRARRDEGVAADGDGDARGGFGCGGVGGGEGADKVAADADVRLDDSAAAEDDVLRAVDLRAARDFVAGVLCG